MDTNIGNGCSICEHPERVNIESALLSGQKVKQVSKFYKVELGELTQHAGNCAAYVMSLDEFDAMVAEETKDIKGGYIKPGSLQRQLNIREGDILAGVAHEYMTTLKNLGRRINKFINMSDSDEGLARQMKFLRLPVANLYVQIGAEIRQTVKTMADIDKQLNVAEPESPLTGLQVLASAITKSAQGNASTK